MKNIMLLGCLLSLVQVGNAQVPVDLSSSTNGQSQSLHATNSIELGDGFSSTSEIDISIVAPINTTGQWAAAHWDFQAYNNNNVFIGIHTSVLPNGIVLSWQGHNDNQYSTTGSPHPGTDMYRWDPSLNQLLTTIFHVDWTNAFCTGHSFLADGKLLVTGGHDRTVLATKDAAGNIIVPEYIKGLNSANTYDYTKNPDAFQPNTAHDPLSWHKERDMIRNRWYPTNTTLNSGAVLTTSGETEPA
ncbi:hypothetical protein [Hymenobacter convexus]|uniref:hypothetical protein n=1 Tax=Hymenobacter sp. CA1UV-4 TaxID=3063782 RepID=UPI0027140C6F|nr:hypothetical protein [Hymenobacter sp. CA1UV-4]MDO7850752.1 hypothetical protein [Hymenobacter sp. CA1UV-4]